MKRFLFAFLSVFSVVFLFGFTSKAYSDQFQYVIDYCSEHWPNLAFNDTQKLNMDAQWTTDEFFVLVENNTLIFNVGGPFVHNDTGVSNPNGNRFVRAFGNTSQSGSAIRTQFDYTYVDYPDGVGMHYFGTRDDVDNAMAIDYDDLIFDPSIPVPKYTSLYGILPLWNLGGSVNPQFPIQTFFTSMPQYKIEVQVRYYSPSKITFNGSRRSALSEDWNINYNYDSLMPSEWYPLVTMQDDIQNDELALVDSDYYYSWNNFITGYDSELIEYVLDPVFISASANTSIKAYAETEYAKMRNIGGCYGNEFEIMARNFYINDGNVYVGNWFHWNSLTPDSGTAEYPSDVVQDNTVNGVQNTVNTTDLPTGNSLTTIGQPTGNAYNPSNNIIINQNVPNYPDYPTVADYNRDNLLVGFIKTAKSMPQYLGEFNDFLKLAFSFIDPSVWAVISLGFGASIVIMIIKVL